MSENRALQNIALGDERPVEKTDARVRRTALLTPRLAEDCATKMFTERAEGPHALVIDPVSIFPTIAFYLSKLPLW